MVKSRIVELKIAVRIEERNEQEAKEFALDTVTRALQEAEVNDFASFTFCEAVVTGSEAQPSC